uniref:GUN4-like domain-containing protein n=1 Tax=Polysiphonia sertularioides TaxID=945028 RepID=A0A1Z1MFR3_9FLOR|nr:hypothetical protein [Polysiphonia sertularioides]
MEQKEKIQKISKKEINKIFSKYEDNGIISTETEKRFSEIINKQMGGDVIISTINDRLGRFNKLPSVIDGFAYQILKESKNKDIVKKLHSALPDGVINLQDSMELNYQPLQTLLIDKEFQKADKLTQEYLCKIVEQKNKIRKKWLYFTDIQFVPRDDLLVIDLLWRIYSRGKFGFSVQKKIWIVNNKKWDKLWKKIKWIEISSGIMKRYPQGFSWTLDAPEGHLPLFNQLRGTQSLAYLFKNINW